MTNPANTDPTGTGPFRLESYTPNAELRLSANPDYFESDLPYLDEVVMRIIPERGNQVVALEAGEVDWLFGVSGPDLARLQETGDFGFLETSVNPGGSNSIMTVSLSLDRPLFQDATLRRGLATALDREQFVERVLFGQGRVAEAPISSGIPFAHAPGLEGMPQFDRAEAESLLDEAGWQRDGNGVRTAGDRPRRRIGHGAPPGPPAASSGRQPAPCASRRTSMCPQQPAPPTPHHLQDRPVRPGAGLQRGEPTGLDRAIGTPESRSPTRRHRGTAGPGAKAGTPRQGFPGDLLVRLPGRRCTVAPRSVPVGRLQPHRRPRGTGPVTTAARPPRGVVSPVRTLSDWVTVPGPPAGIRHVCPRPAGTSASRGRPAATSA